MRHEGKMQGFLLNALMFGAVGYIGYQLIVSLFGKIKATADDLTKPLADRLAQWLMPAPINVTGSYVLQDNGGVLIPTSYPVTWVNSSDPAAAPYGGQLPTITYAGRTYVLGQHDERGNYPAVPI